MYWNYTIPAPLGCAREREEVDAGLLSTVEIYLKVAGLDGLGLGGRGD